MTAILGKSQWDVGHRDGEVGEFESYLEDAIFWPESPWNDTC